MFFLTQICADFIGLNLLDNLYILNKELETNIIALFQSWAKEPVESLTLLPQSGSDRRYFRLKSQHHQVLAAYNISEKENQTFIDYTRHFRAKGLNLPEVYAEVADSQHSLGDLKQHIYLLQDLGDVTLLEFLEQNKVAGEISERTIYFYKKALAQLALMQTKGVEGLEIEKYHSPASFDQQAMLWDTQYFKYCYLKTTKIEFEEYLLEKDFQTLVRYLSEEKSDYFLFRDFQARNIMLVGEEVYFVDYQGGKLGALQYDVVSLLFQAKAQLSNELREELLDYYIQEVSKYTPINVQQFKDKYYLFVLIRTLQVLGAYGYKGLFERKEHFIASIPYALENLSWLLQTIDFPIEINYLRGILKEVTTVQPTIAVTTIAPIASDKLVLDIQSFAYKNGIPKDTTGNGGGFVFDCRFIHNPGRYEPYKKLTGRDQAVIDFFKENSTIDAFVQKVSVIVEEAVESYLERGFSNLSVHFGCTGGQHRSVYSADWIANYLKAKYPDIQVNLHHREQEAKHWKN